MFWKRKNKCKFSINKLVIGDMSTGKCRREVLA